MKTEQEYSHTEYMAAMGRLAQATKQSLADRKEAQSTWLEALIRYPEQIANKIDWLIEGHYGYGEMLVARNVLSNPRNRSGKVAQLAQLIACYEWGCDDRSARAAFKKLTPEQQAQVNALIQAVIEERKGD